MYFKRNLKKKVQKNSGIADIGAFEIGSFFPYSNLFKINYLSFYHSFKILLIVHYIARSQRTLEKDCKILKEKVWRRIRT